VNDLRITHLIKTISQAIGGFEGRRVSLWGLTYKAGTDDLRDSPSVRLAETLLKAGAQVPVFDPYLQPGQIAQFGCKPCQTAQESLVGVDALATLTRCPEFAAVPAADIISAISPDYIFDVVGALPQL